MLRKPDADGTPVTVPVGIDFERVLGRQQLPYEAVLLGATAGNAEYFAFFPTIMESWRIVDPVLDPPEPPLPYAPGSWGPAEAARLPGLRQWHQPSPRLFGDESGG